MIKQFLTLNHVEPQQHVLKNNLWFPVMPLISTNNVEELAKLEIFLHETPEGIAPFGYTEWVFDEANKKFTRLKNGTEEEIANKLASDELIHWRNNTAVEKIYCKLALQQSNLLSNVYTIIENLDLEEKLYFNEHPTWRRMHPLVIKVGKTHLNLSDERLDDLFRLALQKKAENE